MKKTIHINLWGGPSTGKSGISGHLFGLFKEKSISCELVREVAKEYAWNNTLKTTEQIIITTKQYEEELSKHGKVDYIISDTSVLLGYLYGNDYYKEELLKIIFYLTKDWEIKHYFIERDPNKCYEIDGRTLSYSESIAKDKEIIDFFEKYKISYKKIPINMATEYIYKDLFKF